MYVDKVVPEMGDLTYNNSSSYCLGVKHLGILKLKRTSVSITKPN